MNVVIVESPAKAKTINKYLGPNYRVLASYGHVRDLPSKDGSVAPDNDFEMHWDVDAKSAKRLNEIASAVKGAEKLILATDPDREGEAISWHVLQVLMQKGVLKDVPVERVVFNAVTKQAVIDALQHPRTIDAPLVDAYLARRALDYLVGFTLSPVLWRKLPGARSAGRVQSVALRLVCDRELEIEAFKTQEYWSIVTDLKSSHGDDFSARLVAKEGVKLDRFDVGDEATAMALKQAIEGGSFSVESVESKAQKRHPAPPFTTSTLQQEASRKLGLPARRAMQIAQKLYEGVVIGGTTQGLITYMRTDGVQIAPEAVTACRDTIRAQYGPEYVPDQPRAYRAKAKNAQEAHEAIRPVELSRLPAEAANYLERDEAAVYRLIWQRTIASQMASAELERTTAEITGRGGDSVVYGMRATGQVVRFDGFLKLYEEGRDENGEGDGSNRLPPLTAQEQLGMRAVTAKQHFTEPPPRYSEASLIKKMEELGIGRPSTYTSTLSVLQDREYVRLEKKRFHPEDKGRLVTAFLEGFFQRYVEYDFTADLEEKLDLISAGKLEWKDVLREFWRSFIAAVDETKDLKISDVLDALDEILGPHIFPQTENGDQARKCPSCEDGRLGLKIGRYGAFVGCSNYSDCRYTRQFSTSDQEAENAGSNGAKLGSDPDSGLEVSLRKGRYGPYVQLGEAAEGEKPKRASIPKNMDPAELTLEQALSLLALPRQVGAHPETGKPIVSGFGRYGPFVEHDGRYANLESPDDVFTVGLNRAVALLAERASKGPRRSTVLKALGDHPELGGPVQILDGRYGPYVKHGKINATLPKDSKPDEVTMAEAVELIAARAAKSGRSGTGKAKRKKKAPASETEAAS